MSTKKNSKRKCVSYTVGIIVVIALALINLFPIYWMISGSFKTNAAARKIPPQWFPLTPTLENYTELFKANSAVRWTFNSFVIAIVTMILVCFVSSMAGYAFAKKNFPFKNIIFWILMSGMMVPYQIMLIPLFKLMSVWHMVNTYAGVVLPAIAFPFGLFLIRQFIQTIPNELLEAARIDGCSEIRTFANIVIPVSMPGIAALAIFSFVNSWNDYLWQLVIIKSNEMKTLPLGVASLQASRIPNISSLMAGASVASIPMIIIFILFQKYFTKGITMGAVKG